MFLAVKPHILPAVLAQVAPFLTPDHLLISVVNATTNEQIEAMCGGAKVCLKSVKHLGSNKAESAKLIFNN